MDTEISAKKGKSGKAVWDAFAAEVFLDVCIEEVLARNRHQGYLNPTFQQMTQTISYDRRSRKELDCSFSGAYSHCCFSGQL
jgi:hypothetical protein